MSRSYLVQVLNHWTWTKTTPEKKWFSWSNPFKTEVMITSLIDILELTLVTWPIYDKIKVTWKKFVDSVIVNNYDAINLFKNIFILRRPGVANFAEIIKILTILIEKIFKDSKKVKMFRNYVPKCNRYLYFLIWQNLLISIEKALMSVELKGWVTWFIYFWVFR